MAQDIGSEVVYLSGGIETVQSGWNMTTEDVVRLISGLGEVATMGGGYLGIGSFHNLDVALDRRSEAVVLMDIDADVVKLDEDVLHLIERAESPDEVLPAVKQYVRQRGMMGPKFFEGYITTGSPLRTRTPLDWAKKAESFGRMKQLIGAGRVAVAHADITNPSSLEPIGKFFEDRHVLLRYANISNLEDPGFKPDLSALANISESLYEAGGDPGTLIISSLNDESPLPASYQTRILHPTIAPVPLQSFPFSFQFKHLVRTLEQFSRQGPINLESKYK